MDSDPTNLYGLIGLLVTTLTTAFVSVKLSKRGKTAGEDAERIDSGVDAVAGFVKLVESQNAAMEGFSKRIKDLEAGQDVTDKIAEGLRERVQKISADLDSMHMWKRAALRYIIDLRTHGLKHSPEETLPAPPIELMGDLREDHP